MVLRPSTDPIAYEIARALVDAGFDAAARPHVAGSVVVSLQCPPGAEAEVLDLARDVDPSVTRLDD